MALLRKYWGFNLLHAVPVPTQLSAGAGGDNRDRTDDLLNAIQTLSQLSYIPKH